MIFILKHLSRLLATYEIQIYLHLSSVLYYSNLIRFLKKLNQLEQGLEANWLKVLYEQR